MKSISTNVKLITILLFIGVAFGCIVLYSFHLQNQMLEQNLAHERRTGTELVDKVVLLGSTALQSIANDYSRWDDMVQFVSTRNPNWPKVNIDPELGIFDVDVIWICDTSASPIYGVDILGDSLASAFPISAVDRDSIVGNNRFHRFFARSKWGLVEIQQAPIQLTDDTLRQSPAKGYFVVGKIWSSAHLQRFSQLSGSQLSIEYSSDRIDSLASQSIHDATINISSPLKDLSGQTTAYLVAKKELTDWQNLRHLVLTQMELILGLLTFVLVALAISLYFWISRPLTAVSRGLERESPELLGSLLRQNSEFGKLARLIRESIDQRRSFVEEIIERQQAQAALRQSEIALQVSEEKYRTVVDFTSGWEYWISAQREIEYMSPACEQMTGYNAAAFIADPALLTRIIHPDDRAVWEDHHGLTGERISTLPDSGELEFRIVTKNGEIRWIHHACRVIRGTDGHDLGRRVSNRDITERKLAGENKEIVLLRQQGTSQLLQSLLTPAPLEDRLRKVTDAIVRLFDADFCRIWLIRPGDLCERGCIHAEVKDGPHVCRQRDRCLQLLTSSGRYTHVDGRGHRRVPFGCYKIGRVASGEDHKFVTNDAQNDPLVHDHDWVRDLGLVSFAGYQLRAPGGETLGVLALFAKHPISADEDAILEGIGSTVALVVKQAVAEESLHRSETRFRTLYNSTSDAVMLLDDSGFFDCNKATLTIFGCATREEFCSKHLADLSPSEQPCGTDSFMLANRRIATAMEKGSNCFEWIHKKVDTGEPFCAEVLLNAMELDGKPIVQAVVRDITERKRAEVELRKSRTTLNLVLDTVPQSIFWKDIEGRYLGCNRVFASAAGLDDPEQIVGKTDFDMPWPREEAEAYRADDRKVLETNRPKLHIIEPLQQADGVRLWIDTSKVPLCDAEGRPFAVLGVYDDITERKRIEDALRASETEHRMLFENAGVGITYCDLDGRVLMTNALAAAQFYGKPEDFVGRTIDEILPPEVATAFHASIDMLTPANTSTESEEMIPFPTGPRWLSAKYTGVFEPNGMPTGVQIITTDITDRKHAEEELRKLSQAVEQSPTSVVITNVQGNIEYVNPKFCELTGYTSAEAIGQNPRFLGSGKTSKETYDLMWSTIGAGRIWTGELLNRKKTGETFWERANISGIKDATGTITHFIALKEDITEQKKIEDEHSRFIAVIEGAPESITILNADGSIMYVNHAFERISGVSSSQAVGHCYEALMQGLYADIDFKIQWDRIHAGESGTESITYQGSDGKLRLVDQAISPIRSESGEIINYVVFSRDVTEERELEIRARWADERLRLSIDGMVDGLTLWDVRMDSDGSIQEFVCSEANPAALMMLGRERQDAVGRNVRELLKGPEDHDPHELFLRVRDRGRSLTVDHWHFLKDNQRLILTIHVWAIGTGVACHLRDVTQQLELETQLRQAQKLEAVGSLAAGIAHEINTPIQFVGDNIRFLADSFSGLMNVLEHHRECREKMAPLLGEQAELQQLRDLDKQVDVDYLRTEIPLAVEQSLEGVSRVSTIVRAMKDFSHIDEREMVLADINQMLDTTLTVARNELKYVADVAKDFAPDLPTVECFRNDLNQVFLNLLVNAAHAIGEVVSAEGEGRGTITVATRQDGDGVVVSISDTGGGIPEGIRDRIFDHFFTTKEVGKGTGQGLSIARSIVVEKHKGAITFDSEIGKGTTFYIHLPITRKEVEHAESQHSVRG